MEKFFDSLPYESLAGVKLIHVICAVLGIGLVLGAAFFGAILGDNSGYWIARRSGTRLGGWLDRHPKRALLRKKSEGFMHKWGGSSVFFSCWLVAQEKEIQNESDCLVGRTTPDSWLCYWPSLGGELA